MRIKTLVSVVVVILLSVAAIGSVMYRGYLTPILPASESSELAETIRLPQGFSIALFADNIPGARSMALDEAGTLFVGTRREGKLYALRDNNKDHLVDQVTVLAEGLNMPNGVALRDGDLYVAEVNRVLKFPSINRQLDKPPKPVVIRDDYPTETHHGWKFIAFGPDGWLYVPVGAPCNVCDPDNPLFATITRLNDETGERQIFAQGVRNSVGFAWHPKTQELWFTDNGRDWLGDDLPPDELNHAPSQGLHFGFPYCHGRDFIDPEFGSNNACEDVTTAAQPLGPHVAALGMRFYTGTQFPDYYRNGIFIAEHGSWNRSTPIGYRITFVKLKDNQPVSYEIFAEGWLKEDGSATGRPVDVQVMPDGSLLVSDDKAGRIYRISYQGRTDDR